MRTLKQLQAANITDTSTANISEFQDIFLSKEIIRFAEALRYFRQAVKENTTLVRSGDKTLRVPITTSHLDITTSHTEGAERTYTEMTNLDTVDITPSFKLGAVAITKELVDTSRVDLIEQAKYVVAQAIEEDIETAITEEIDTTVDSTNVVYGGDATAPDELAAGDTITTDLVADAIKLVKDNNFVPAYLFIKPAQEAVFFKSSQFTNAAEYGSNEVVLNGEIGKYLGVKVITSTLTQSYAANDTDKGISANWGVAGTSCQLVGLTAGKIPPIVLAWKQKPSITYEYLPRYANHYIYYDAAYGVKVVQPKAICRIKVADA